MAMPVPDTCLAVAPAHIYSLILRSVVPSVFISVCQNQDNSLPICPSTAFCLLFDFTESLTLTVVIYICIMSSADLWNVLRMIAILYKGHMTRKHTC